MILEKAVEEFSGEVISWKNVFGCTRINRDLAKVLLFVDHIDLHRVPLHNVSIFILLFDRMT